MLDVTAQAEILTLYYSEKYSVRQIAKSLNINRRSVQRIIDRRSVQLHAKTPVKPSQLDPYKELIKNHLQSYPQMTSTALLNELRAKGFMGGITIVKDYVRNERQRVVRPREAFLRLEFGAGEVAQVDWGEFGDVFSDGVKIHCFAMVLAYSRMIYVEFTRSEKFEEFIRCHENAFEFFGGTPKECWYDNLTSAVSDRMGSLVRFNTRFMAYLGHHGVRPHACNIARGNEKGRVEDLIKYIRMNFWPGRKFTDFDDLTKQFIVWRNQTANQREHRSHRRVVRLIFESDEKSKLMSLNPVPFDTEEVFSRHVPPDFHLQYESNRYSVPWTLVGLTVTVRVNDLSVKIYYNEKLICSHARSYLKNKVFTTETHSRGLIERKPGSTRETWQLGYVKGLGPKMAEYVELVRQGPRSLKNELSRLIALTTVYGEEMVLAACAECLGAGLVGVDNVELYLKRKHHPSSTVMKQAPMKFEIEKLNRVHPAVDLRKYDALLFEVDNQTRASQGESDGSGRAVSERIYAVEAKIVGGGRAGGFGEDAGSREGDDFEIPAPLDSEGASGSKDADDSKQDPDGKVPPFANGGEF